jgi:hypothetical protein
LGWPDERVTEVCKHHSHLSAPQASLLLATEVASSRKWTLCSRHTWSDPSEKKKERFLAVAALHDVLMKCPSNDAESLRSM